MRNTYLICKLCGKEKYADEFYKDRNSKTGREVYCKECSLIISQNPKITSAVQSNKENQKQKQLQRRVNWLKKNPNYRKNYSLMKDFGITLDQWNQMFEDQEGCCAICQTHQSELKVSLAVDHCHHTGQVRGLLCNTCNIGIGGLKDSTDLLQKALNYLKKHHLPIDN